MEINRAAVSEAIKKQENGVQAYYQNLIDTPDLAKPFSLYGNSVRLSTFEKLNLMERETVQVLLSKLEAKKEQIESFHHANTSIEQIKETMTHEKHVV